MRKHWPRAVSTGVLSLLLAIGTAVAAIPTESFDLDTYIALVRNKGFRARELKTLELQTQAAGLEGQPWQASVSAEYSESFDRETSLKLDGRSRDLTTQLTVVAPLGLRLRTGIDEHHSIEAPLDSDWNRRAYSFGLQLDLWRNALGRSQRWGQREAAANIEALNARRSVLTSLICEDALGAYTRLYAQTKLFAIANERYEFTTQLRGEFERQFKQRLLRRESWLAAQNDFLAAVRSRNEGRKNLLAAIAEFYAIADQPVPSDTDAVPALKDPTAPLAALLEQVPKTTPATAAEITQLEREREAIEFDLRQTADARRPRLYLQADADTGRGTPSESNRVRNYGLGVGLAWDFFVPATEAARAAKMAQLESKTIELGSRRREFTAEASTLKQRLALDLESLRLGQRLESVRTEELRLAERNLRSGRIELEDFYQLRSRTLGEQALQAEQLSGFATEVIIYARRYGIGTACPGGSQ